MRIAIRGWKTFNDLFLSKIDCTEIEIVCIIDLNSNLWCKKINNIPVVSPMRAYEKFIAGDFDKVILNPFLGINKISTIVREMAQMGFNLDIVRIPKVHDVYIKNKFGIEDFLSEKYDYKYFKNLYYLEYHIADKCNLNCASCSHFSSLVKQEYYPNIQDVQNDLIRLSQIVDYIEWIRVLGGEPFLNAKWKDYLKITRQIWQYSKISIVTNGILLNTLSNDDKRFLKEYDIWIDISLYKPMWKKIDDIINMLRKDKIKFEVNDTPVFEFTSVFDLNSKDDYKKKRNECNVPCNNMYKGKITPCPIMMYTSFFNSYFNQSLPEGQPIDIYDETLNYNMLIKLLKKDMPICKYCNMTQRKKWKQVDKNNCKIEDWIVTEDY